MILFNLICAKDHEFEGWFRDGASYDRQAAAGEVSCPVCGNAEVRKAPMAPSVLKGRSPAARTAAELRESLAALRRQVEENCDYVGERFPEEARRIHYGESEERAIYGEASAEETRALHDEGISVLPIPWLPRQDS